MAGLRVKALDKTAWPDFAELAERHNGVWNGCWCLAFHAEGGRGKTAAERRSAKEARVCEGRAHAALVYDGARCVGWCQFGPAEELPRIKHQKAYRAGLTALPDWRITCFFVDKSYRGTGVANAALEGALKEIARLGAERSKAIPRTWRAARPPPPSSTTERSPCSSGKASRGRASSARITGWSPSSCPRADRAEIR